jgi:6-hydroxytryprostatin B O-methyltransferase
MAQAVPLEGEVAMGDLARATGLTEVDTARIVRRAAMGRVFVEKRRGFVSHSAISAMLAQDEGMQALVGHMCDGAFPASAKMCDFLDQFSGSPEPHQSPYALAYGDPIFARGAKEPQVMERFVGMMKAWSAGDGTQTMIDGYDWDKLGSGRVVDVRIPAFNFLFLLLFMFHFVSLLPLHLFPGPKLVLTNGITNPLQQVGGAAGHISLALAARFPNLEFTVQDQEAVGSQAQELMASYPAEVQSRVQWTAHNFFSPQPAGCRGANVYVLRYICHDWTDVYAAKILAGVAAAMGPDSVLVIADAVLPPESVKLPVAQETLLRSFDVSMLCQLNARERGIDDWAKVLQMADERLHITGVKPPAIAGEVTIIEARLGV